MGLIVGRTLSHFATVFFLLFCSLFAFAGPARTTYQAKIVKPDGYPLEASSVNFKFTILDPTGACILYSETYSSVNMGSTGGLISFSLGSGVKTYPASSPTFADVFSNITPSLSCDAGGPVSYSPAANDTRKIVMQFHDGSGWQTLPAMNINAVPYAMYADEATKLSGKLASDFVEVSTIPTCTASQVLQFNGTSFSCLTLAAGVSVTSGTISSALGYMPADNSSMTTVTATVSTLGTSLTALTSSFNTTATSATILTTAMNNMVTSYFNLATSMSSIVSSQWVSSGTGLTYNSGYVGIGSASPTSRLTVGEAASETTVINDGADSITLFGNGNAYFQGRDVVNHVEFIMGTSTSAGEVFSGSMSAHDYSLRTGNSKRIIMTASGTVGIGVASATAKLQIVAGTSSTPQLKLNTSVLTTAPQSGAIEYDGANLYFTDSTSTRRALATAASATVTDYTSAISATANITMTPSGSVIVSSTTASTNAGTGALIVKGGLGVSGSIYSSGTITTTSNIQGVSLTATSGLITPIIYGGSNISGNLLLESTTNSTKGNVLITNGGGNVGIGTGTPLAKLSVDGDGFSPNTPIAGTVATFDNESADVAVGLFTSNFRKASMYFGVTAAASRGAVSYQFSSPSSFNDTLNFNVNTLTRMTITGSGSVGIGTASPNALLDLNNSTQVSERLRLSGQEYYQSGNTDTNGISFLLGVNRTGNRQLWIADSAQTASGTSYSVIRFNPNSRDISAFATDGVTSKTLTLNGIGGFVGVGMTGPTAKLHVAAGNVNEAPLKMSSGTLTSTPQAGAIEYDGSDFYVTDNSLVRRTLASAQGGNVNVQNNLYVSGTLGVGSSDTSMANIHLRSAVAGNDIIYIDRTDASPNLDIYSSYNGLSNIQSGTFAYGVRPGNDAWQIWERGYNATWTNYFNVSKDGKVGVGTQTPSMKFTVAGGDLAVADSSYPGLYTVNTSKIDGTYGRTWGWLNYGGGLYLNGYASVGNSYAPGAPISPIFISDTTGNIGINTTNVNEKFRVVGKIKVGTETDTVSANFNSQFNDVFELVSPGAASAPAMTFHQRGLHTVQLGSWGTSVSQQGLEIKSGPSEAAAQLRVQSHITSNGGNLHTNRGRVAFSYTPQDFNHTIYNNLNNLDNEGVWDGMKMNVYNGLSVRVGDATSGVVPTTAMYINSSANVGIGTTTPASKLHVNGDLTLATGSKFTWPIDGGGGGGDAAYIRYHFDEGGENGSFDFVTQNDANDDMKFKAGYFTFLPNAIGNGFVGIGTPSPTQALDVSGTVKANAFVGDGSQLTNINPSVIQYNDWTAGWASGQVPWTSYAYGVSGWQDYTGTAVGAGSTFWSGWTMKNGATGAQFAVNWNVEAGQTGGAMVRAKDDTNGNWGAWRSLAFTDASVQKTGDTMTGALTINSDLTITGTPYRAGGDVAWQIPSDKRLKDVKSTYSRGLKELLNIETIIYTYKKDNPKNIDPTIEYTGVLAQNVKDNIPEAVKQDKDGFLSLNTTPIFWAIVNAIKDLYHDITGVQREIASLKEDNKAKDQEIKDLKERLDRIEKTLIQQQPAK